MENPWKSLVIPTEDYVHPLDRAAWGHSCPLPPQPYLGSYDSGRVMWLLGGFGTGTDMAIEHPAHRSAVLDWTKRNLGCGSPSVPNLWIGAERSDQTFLETRDVRWWRRATSAPFSALSIRVGVAEAWKILSIRLFVLEAFPYPAKNRPKQMLPTHAYTAHLLTSWLASGRPVVVGRAENFWSDLAPTLNGAIVSGQAVRVRNVQAASISPGNLQGGNEVFSALIEALI